MFTNLSLYVSDMHFTTCFLLIVTCFFIFPILSNLLNVLKATFHDFYNKITLFKTITNDKRNSYTILCSLFKTVLVTFWNLTKQKYMNNVEKVKNKKNLYKVKFVIGGRIYQVLVKHNPLPSDLIQVIDNTTNSNITEIIEPFYNSKNLEFNPRIKDLGFNSISLLTTDGNGLDLQDEDKLYDKEVDTCNLKLTQEELDLELHAEFLELAKFEGLGDPNDLK